MVTSRVLLAPLVLAAAVSARTFMNYSGVPNQLGLLLQDGHAQLGADPCRPTPCGPLTECSVTSRGVGVCRCLPGYFPKPDTVTGCGPQCERDSECSSYRFICRNQKCIDPCIDGNPCGINADCAVVSRRCQCTCPVGYEGSPYSRCSPAFITGSPPAPPSDPCSGSVCGANADCANVSSRAVCSCPAGYQGNPLTGCRRGECTDNVGCPRHQACIDLKCQDPCRVGVCGSGADCAVENHGASCSCPQNYIGDPLVSCRYDPEAACTPSPCGQNTNCKVQNGRAICSCIQNYIGNALSGCRPECVSNGECAGHQSCVQNRCRNACSEGACGQGARCEASNNRAVCSCPKGYKGHPFYSCRPGTTPPPPPHGVPCSASVCGECTDNVGCPRHQACIDLKCQDPCRVGVCGSGADCAVENHVASCSCPQNCIGDPLVSCRYDPEAACTPSPCGQNTNCKVQNGRAICSCIQNYIGNALSGCRPECVSNGECAGHQSCVQNRCRNACSEGACGQGARCDASNHRAVCSCPQYYRGSGLTGCYPECTSHSECASHQACFKLRCTDPCVGACGVGADCKVTNHKAICSCPKGYEGHPFDSCRPAQPKDLCSPNPCGQGANCNPGTDNTGAPRPVCTCPRGYFGDALTFCQRGECETSSDCPSSQACYGYHCRNPCLSEAGGNVCGTNALCNAKRHKAVCYCPQEYTGSPLSECRLKPVARSNNRRYKRFLDGLLSLARREAAEETAEQQ